jgi:recombination protein RecR
MIGPVDDLTRTLARLPGLGRRSASRAALALLREPEKLLDPLVWALRTARESVVCCSRCGAFTVREADPCTFCTDPMRDSSVICVVEEPADIITIEASGAFHGRYHALGGKLSPVHRVGPDSLRFRELAQRVVTENIVEVLIAVSTDMEGDATAGYLAELLCQSGVKTTRLAFGIPADSGVSYSDPLTLRRAINSRTPMHTC